ncbi:MAG: (E)-4-hydroxy-3-methylbut-2-enyl-diphosphate synthase [Elusimicrobia bacterium]|nr:(E)-4-hydroxy-3-methylbut-2-enyl-diphosphate synthase [Elusimicrobiota bacterium]
MDPLPFSPDVFAYQRRPTRVVRVGDVGVGGDNPLRLQSMTTTRTQDTDATVAQAIRLVQAGCEIVRITAPSEVDARNLKNIAAALRAKGVRVPLVADIHFRPDAALEAAEHVEKVRINPGNFSDAKAFKTRDYTDREYALELERIEERFTPLVLKLKRLGRALRIGTNHGSLSDRILNRFGDTPEGMVESALEFLRVCRKNDYHDVIFSMKASNPKVMIAAYRLLAARLDAEGGDYPFHLGVTEAGDGEDGRIKSAVGIGALLEDGLGDTVRVSLTEDPEFELPVARRLTAPYQGRAPIAYARESGGAAPPRDPTHYSRRPTRELRVGPVALGKDHPPRVAVETGGTAAPDFKTRLDKIHAAGLGLAPELVVWPAQAAVDIDRLRDFKKALGFETRVGFVLRADGPVDPAAALAVADALWLPEAAGDVRPAARAAADAGKPLWLTGARAETLLAAAHGASTVHRDLVLGLRGADVSFLLHQTRFLTSREWVAASGIPLLLVLPPQDPGEESLLGSAVLAGGLLTDGLGDALFLSGLGLAGDLERAGNLLQGAGARISKTEFVSCPSCGRTLFDLQTTTERIKRRTGHLKNVKIAIMGCIVNGPGEMADADFGYVGGGVDKINLYVGKECVEKGIATADADERLVALIRRHGKWTDPS